MHGMFAYTMGYVLLVVHCQVLLQLGVPKIVRTYPGFTVPERDI